MLSLLTSCRTAAKEPTVVVDPAAFERGIDSIAFVGGDTPFPDIQARIVDALAAKYTRVAKPGTVYRREAVLVQLGSVVLPAPPTKKVLSNAREFGGCAPALAQAIAEKVKAEAIYAVWVLDWTGQQSQPFGVAGRDGAPDAVRLRREVVAMVCEAGTGRELWHTRWSRTEIVRPRFVPEDSVQKELDGELETAIEEIWVAFWL